jgi:hypothetical protein
MNADLNFEVLELMRWLSLVCSHTRWQNLFVFKTDHLLDTHRKSLGAVAEFRLFDA